MDDQLEVVNIKELRETKPAFIEDILLLSPGVWNGTTYTLEELSKAFFSTNWSDKSTTHLYMDHQDTQQKGVGNWIGFVKNPRMVGEELRGDLEIWNPMIATFLNEAKAKFGVSATMLGREDSDKRTFNDFRYESFSIVTKPGCDPAWINLSKQENSQETKKCVTCDNNYRDGVTKELATETSLSVSNPELKDVKGEKEMESKKLEEEQVEKVLEEKTEETKESKEEVKEEAEAKVEEESKPEAVEESKEESAEEENLSKESKVSEDLSKVEKLESKVSELAKAIGAMSDALGKLIEKKDSKELSLEKADKELEESTKELSLAQENFASPDRVTLSDSVSSEEAISADSTRAMLGFLQNRLD